MAFTLDWRLLVDGRTPNPLLKELRDASPQEASDVLEAMRERARADRSPSAVNDYAVGLAETGSDIRATRLWESLVAYDSSYAVGWLNLATLQARRSDFAQASETLRRGRPHIEDGEYAAGLDQRLVELQQVQSAWEQQQRLLNLQVAALRERTNLGIAKPSDSFRLAWLVSALSQVRGSTVTNDEALAAARRAYAENPESTQALEVLALALLRAAAQDELDEVLRELERKAPHSKALEALRAMRSDASAVRESTLHQHRGNELVGLAFDGDREAEAELRELNRLFPHNQHYRVGLMMASRARGDWAEATRIADGLAAEPKVEHLTHFHVAQYYWHVGQRKESLRHFALAYATARDERDREDVRTAMRVVGAGDVENLTHG